MQIRCYFGAIFIFKAVETEIKPLQIHFYTLYIRCIDSTSILISVWMQRSHFCFPSNSFRFIHLSKSVKRAHATICNVRPNN